MSTVFMILAGAWLVLKHILFVSVVLMAILVPSYALSRILLALRSPLVLTIVCILFLSNMLMQHINHPAIVLLLLAGITMSIVRIVTALRTINKKSVRELSYFRKNEVVWTSFYIGAVATIILYAYLPFFNTLLPSIDVSQYKLVFIHSFIALLVLYAYGFIPTWNALKEYQDVHSVFRDQGWISATYIYNSTCDALVDSALNESEKYNRANDKARRLSEMCANIARYELGFVRYDLKETYYLTTILAKRLERFIANAVFQKNGMTFSAFLRTLSIPFQNEDLKILFDESILRREQKYNGNGKGSATLNCNDKRFICDFCNGMTDNPIVKENGTFCSEACYHAELGFYEVDDYYFSLQDH